MATGTRNFVKNLKSGKAQVPLPQRSSKRIRTHHLQQSSKSTRASTKNQNGQLCNSIVNLQAELDQSRDELFRERRRRIEAEQLLDNNRRIFGSIQKSYDKEKGQLEKAKELLEVKEKTIRSLRLLLTSERDSRKQDALKYKQTVKMLSSKLNRVRKRNAVGSESEYASEDNSDANPVDSESSNCEYLEYKTNGVVDVEGEENEPDPYETDEPLDCQPDERVETRSDDDDLEAETPGKLSSRMEMGGCGGNDCRIEGQSDQSSRKETESPNHSGAEAPVSRTSRMETGGAEESRIEGRGIHSTRKDTESPNHSGAEAPESRTSRMETGGADESRIEGQSVHSTRKEMEDPNHSVAEASELTSARIEIDGEQESRNERQAVHSTLKETESHNNSGAEAAESRTSRMETGGAEESRIEGQSIHSTPKGTECHNQSGAEAPVSRASRMETGGDKESRIEREVVHSSPKKAKGPNHTGAEAPKAGSSRMKIVQGSKTNTSRNGLPGEKKSDVEEEDDDDDFQSSTRRHKPVKKDRQPTKAEPKMRKCNICGVIFKTDNFYRHRDSHNSQNGGYACQTCGKVYTRPDNLKRHKLVHKNK